MIRELLPRLLRGERLSREECGGAVRAMVRGESGDAEIAAFLAAMAQRGETAEELLGGAEALRVEAVPFPCGRETILDTCGVGGDGAHTFNISTAAALVAAAAGVPVAKHGNRSVSSRSGSADVLEALGAAIDLGPLGASRILEETGFTFLNARRFHPAMRHVARARAELGIRTLFNWLGPLANPAHATHQLVGVPERESVPMVAEVLSRLGVRRGLVVHGAGGLDELSLEDGNVAVETGADGVGAARAVEARSIGLPPADARALRGGDPAQNAAMIRALFSGERGPRRDALVLNAAAALWISGAAPTIGEGALLAAEQLDSGRVMDVLGRFVALSRKVGAE
ncbi:MAG: anthranilate phosphoribosyltransferase [Candidatus Latescibacteria bacterium]|nr:anthranilate phosphoribosyltransferase [Candidatus Latescibacterota bacterium]